METLTITLPPQLKEFVDRQTAERGFGTPSEFIQALIREAERANAREKVDALLLEAMEEPAEEMTQADWDELRRRARERQTLPENT